MGHGFVPGDCILILTYRVVSVMLCGKATWLYKVPLAKKWMLTRDLSYIPLHKICFNVLFYIDFDFTNPMASVILLFVGIMYVQPLLLGITLSNGYYICTLGKYAGGTSIPDGQKARYPANRFQYMIILK